jgi:predicted RNA polymerase sigma factor
LLTNKETINKRRFRAREKLRLEKVSIEFPFEGDRNARLETALTTLYLLFNEGYYSESQDAFLRKDLCLGAMRLTYQIIENESTSQAPVNAMLSLMCFHCSRFEARKNDRGEIVLYHGQDEKLWNVELITKGAYYLHQASRGYKISKYHLEASIANWLTIKTDSEEKWENVLQLSNQLLITAYSPIAALNRTSALPKVYGKAAAIVEAEKLDLSDNPFYYGLWGELFTQIDNDKATANFEKAISLAKTKNDKHTLKNKIMELSVH